MFDVCKHLVSRPELHQDKLATKDGTEVAGRQPKEVVGYSRIREMDLGEVSYL